MDQCDFKATRRDNLHPHLKKKHGIQAQSTRTVREKEPTELDHPENNCNKGATPMRSPPDTVALNEPFWTYANLYQAATTGSIPLLQASLEAGLDFNKCADDGSSALHCAARAGQALTVQYLLTNRAIKDTQNHKLRAPVHEAILSGDLKTVECLLRNGANLDGLSTTMNCLARCGNAQILQSCIIHVGMKAPVNFVYGILKSAARTGHLSTVQVLLPILEKHPNDTVEWLKNTELATNFKALELPWLPGSTTVYSSTPLHYAAEKGHLEIVQMLAKSSINFKLVNKKSRSSTPLQLAAIGGHTSVVEYLLTLRDSNVNCKDHDQRTLLHLAARNGRAETAQFLLSNTRINTRCLDHVKHSPLLLAALGSHWDVVQMLLKHEDGHQVEMMTDDSVLKSRTDPSEVLKTVLEHPDFQNVNVSEYSSGGLLHSAIRKGECNILMILLDWESIDVHLSNYYFRPPLYLATELGRTDAIRMLIQHKDIDVNQRGYRYGTALNIARKKGHVEIADLLLTHGAKDRNSEFDEALARRKTTESSDQVVLQDHMEDASSSVEDELWA
jgi:ankyrin repeat protein